MGKHKVNKTIIANINYSFVFCPRYKRKIFKIEGVANKLKEIIERICIQLDIKITRIEFFDNYVYLSVQSSPTLSPVDIMYRIKTGSSGEMRESFSSLSKMPNLWTRNFLVSTESHIDKDSIEVFINKQKNR